MGGLEVPANSSTCLYFHLRKNKYIINLKALGLGDEDLLELLHSNAVWVKIYNFVLVFH